MEIEEKYNLIIDGKRRLYNYPLPERLYNLEHTAPETLSIGGDILNASSWGELICKTVICLMSLHPKKKEELLEYKTEWSSSNIFSDKKRINHVEILSGLFVNLNHTALHYCWLVIDLLAYFNINYSACELIIHRMPKAEPVEIRDYIRKQVKEEFSVYLSRHKLFSKEKIVKVIRNIDYLNSYFSKRRSGYDDLYLFDDALMFATMKSKFIPEFASKTNDFTKYSELAKKYLDYLSDYYRDCGYYSKNT